MKTRCARFWTSAAVPSMSFTSLRAEGAGEGRTKAPGGRAVGGERGGRGRPRFRFRRGKAGAPDRGHERVEVRPGARIGVLAPNLADEELPDRRREHLRLNLVVYAGVVWLACASEARSGVADVMTRNTPREWQHKGRRRWRIAHRSAAEAGTNV